MKVINKRGILFLVLFSSIFSYAQNITFKAETNKKKVTRGESFQVMFYIEAEDTDYSIDKPMTYPDFNGLRLIGEDRSQMVQYVNGKGIIQDGIILAFNPEKEGRYRIGAAKIVIDGKIYTTKPIEIEVTKESHNSISDIANYNKPAFLQTNVSKKDPYVNEQVNLTVKFYAKDISLLNRKRNFKQGKLDGLNPKMITSRPETIKQEMVSGKQYFSEEVAKYVVYPQKEGKIEIDPFSMDILISGMYGTEAIPLKSNPVTLNAKALPEKGKPANFNGAVGNFTLKTSLDKNTLETNESTNLTIEIEGKGNLNSVNIPSVSTPKNLEVYSNNRKNNFKTYEDGIQGSVAAEMVMVPEYSGEYAIEPVEFSYFDPVKEKYFTLKSDPLTINVTGNSIGNASIQTNNNQSNTNNSDDSTIVQSFVNEIKNGGKFVYISGGLLATIILGFIFLYRKKDNKNTKDKTTTILPKEEKISNNTRAIKNIAPVSTEEKQEIEILLKNLKKSIDQTDLKVFYQQQENLLYKLGLIYSGLNLSDFSEEKAVSILKERGIKEENINNWQNLLHKARVAKYSPNSNLSSDIVKIYIKTEDLVKEFIY